MKIHNNPILKEQYIQLLHTAFSRNFACDLVECQPGEVILRQGEALTSLYFLMRGKVKIYSTSLEGKRLIVAFNRPIQLFGDVEFLQGSTMINTVEALGTVQFLRFSITEAKRLQRETTFNDYLLDSLSRKFYTKSEVLSFHLLNEASTRFASYLLSISHNEQGQFTKSLVKKSELAEIAEFINSTVRHQNRIIQTFVEEQILERTREGIIIKSPHLLQQKAAHNVYELQ
ncbi:MAG: Crp/Fnr family transcriptional regulator [Solibacillus sp.]